MLVKNWMSKPPITVNADTVLVDAINLLQKHEIRMLPVMVGARLVGIVTDQDLKRACAPDSTSSKSPNRQDRRYQKAMSDIMTPSPVTISD